MNILTCLACLSPAKIHGLSTPSPPPQPSSSSAPSTLGGRNNNEHLFDSLVDRNAQQNSPPPNQEVGEEKHPNPVTNLFHRFFPNHHDGSGGSRLSLTNILPDFTFAIPNINLPDMSFTSSMFTKLNSHEKYQQIEDFDVGLAKDIEEALLLANSNLAGAEGLSGDGKGNASFDAKRNELLNRHREDSNSSRDRRVDSLESKEKSKIPLFNENNVADWDLADLKQRRIHTGKQNVSGESQVNAQDAKPSLFQETNAAHQQMTRLGRNYLVDAQIIDNHVIAREAKPSLFQETNVAIQALSKFNSRNDAITIDNFANAADVKENYIDRRITSYNRRNDLNNKRLASLLDGSGVVSNHRKMDMQSAMRHDFTRSMARKVDAAAASAQAAWNDGSLHHYALHRSRIPQQRDNLVGSSPGTHGFAGVDTMKSSTYEIGEVEDSKLDGNFCYEHANIAADRSVISDESIHANGGTTVDDDSVNNTTSSRKIFVTERALELARTLKFDVCDVFKFKMNELNLDFDGKSVDVEIATVTVNDVRDYLDQRYEQLMLMVSMNKVDQRQAPRTRKDMNINGRRMMNCKSGNNGHENRARTEDSFDWREGEFPPNESKLLLWSRRQQQQHHHLQRQIQPLNHFRHMQNNHRDGAARLVRRTDWMNRQRSDDDIIMSTDVQRKFMNP